MKKGEKKLYKLTDEFGETMGKTRWVDSEGKVPKGGITNSIDPGITLKNPDLPLCSRGWIHAYESPLLAVLLNPKHSNFPPDKMRLFEARGIIGERDHQLKIGTRSLTTIREIPIPQITPNQKTAFGILCVKGVEQSPTWNRWADNWLNGKDRSAASAWAAAPASAWADC